MQSLSDLFGRKSSSFTSMIVQRDFGTNEETLGILHETMQMKEKGVTELQKA